MIDIKRNHPQQQNRCDHVFSFTSQDGVHVFKCESCGVEHRFTGDSKADSFADTSAFISPL